MAILTRLLLRHCEPFSALIAATFGGAMVLGHLLVKPHLLALSLLVIWSGALIAARDVRGAPPAWLLPLIAGLHDRLKAFDVTAVAVVRALSRELAHVRHAEPLGLVGPLAIAASLARQIAGLTQAAPASALS